MYNSIYKDVFNKRIFIVEYTREIIELIREQDKKSYLCQSTARRWIKKG